MSKRKETFKPRYSCADVLQLFRLRQRDQDEGRLRNLAYQFRSLCRLEYAVTIPAQYKAITKEVRTPFMRDASIRIAAALVGKPPVERITPKDEAKQEYRDSAVAAEKFDLAMFERLSKELGRDLGYNLTYQHVRDGESVLKVMHRADAWGNFPARLSDEDADTYNDRVKRYKRGADLPIAMRDVDRLSIVYEGGEYGDTWVMEYGEYTRPFLAGVYQMANGNYGGEGDGNWHGLIDPKNVDPSRTLEGKPMPEGLKLTSTGRSIKIEFWTAEEWHVIIDGSEAPGFPKANPYAPYLPYFRAPAYDMESLLYSLLFLVPRLDELLTMKLNWAYLGSYPNPVLKRLPSTQTGLDLAMGDPGETSTAADQKPLTWAPGKLMQLPLGYDLSFLVPPPVGADLNELVQIFKGLIDIAGVPSIMRGIAGSGDSGYLANQMRAAAETVYKLSAIALQRQREKAIEFAHFLVDRVIQQPVYVLGWQDVTKTGRPNKRGGQAWLGLAPAEDWGRMTPTERHNMANLDHLGPVACEYRPTLPTDEQARAMIALQLTNAQKPLYDRRHALEIFMQEEDPESILDAIAVEDALNSPPLKQIQVDHALQEAGLAPPQPPNPNGLVTPGGAPLMGPAGQQLAGPGGVAAAANPNVPMAGASLPGQPGQPGLTMPFQPGAPAAPNTPGPEGIPGNPGGRRPGMYPGRPGGPNR